MGRRPAGGRGARSAPLPPPPLWVPRAEKGGAEAAGARRGWRSPPPPPGRSPSPGEGSPAGWLGRARQAAKERRGSSAPSHIILPRWMAWPLE
ncbi:LOW QUALITY PROTEIN: uncharacterized protein WM294_004418 [Sarcoramphus papa]